VLQQREAAVTVDAGRPALLITGAGASQQVHQIDVLEDGAFVVPLHWAFRRKTVGGTLCLPDMTCATVQQNKLVGIARPRDLGVPLFSIFYFLLLFVGLFTLSIPARLRPMLADAHSVGPRDLAKLLIEATRQNPNHYTRASASDIEQRLARAKTFAQMRKAFE